MERRLTVPAKVGKTAPTAHLCFLKQVFFSKNFSHAQLFVLLSRRILVVHGKCSYLNTNLVGKIKTTIRC
jgi:hypothetical protein